MGVTTLTQAHQRYLIVTVLLCLAVMFHFRWELQSEFVLGPITVGTKSYTWRETPPAHLPFDNATRAYWEVHLLPKNQGYIYSIDASGAAQMHSIGMLHQLHCLGVLRSEFTRLLAGERGALDFFSLDQHDHVNHLGHCLDLIRQNILCAADQAIEAFNGDALMTKGEGVEHQCGDFELIMEMSSMWMRF